jgi:hypothetical protein
LDTTSTVFLGTIGIGFAGLAWKIFSELNKLQDTSESGSFQRRLNELFSDFQALSLTPRILSVFQRANRRSSRPGQAGYFSEPEAQVQLGEIGGALNLLIETANYANTSLDSLSSSGIISAVGSALLLGTALVGLIFQSEVLIVAICEFTGTTLGVSYFYSRFRLKKGTFFEKEQGFRTFLGG